MEEMSDWYKNAVLDDECTPTTHCVDCDIDGICDPCDTVNGIYSGSNTIAALGDAPVGATGVFGHSSTCDGPCMELTANQMLHMDPQTQLGYCIPCKDSDEFDPEIRARIEKFEADGYPDEAINPHPVPRDQKTEHYNPKCVVPASFYIPGE
jgi:hypothetical protein